MGIHILKGNRWRQEQRIGRYMQEIRDVVQAGLNRRELLKMGLVMGSAGLAALRGMRAFRPHWAYADDDNGGLRLISPPNGGRRDTGSPEGTLRTRADKLVAEPCRRVCILR